MAEREPRSIRKHRRIEKAEIRRKFELIGKEVVETRIRAVQRLASLDLRLLSYINSEKKEDTKLHIVTHDVQNTIKLGQSVGQKISQEISNSDTQTLGGIALNFVEKVWIENALGLIKLDKVPIILSNFLDGCDEKVQNYLEGKEYDHKLTRLQETRNRVINPVTRQLDIK